jgi:hypothetical protein
MVGDEQCACNIEGQSERTTPDVSEHLRLVAGDESPDAPIPVAGVRRAVGSDRDVLRTVE